MKAPEICPHCGADVPRAAKACPECGSDERTGWSEEAAAANLGLPDDAFDYDQFVREEFGGRGGGARRRLAWPGWVLLVVVVLLLVAALVRG